MKVTITHTAEKVITEEDLFYIVFGSPEKLYEEYKKREREQEHEEKAD